MRSTTSSGFVRCGSETWNCGMPYPVSRFEVSWRAPTHARTRRNTARDDPDTDPLKRKAPETAADDLGRRESLAQLNIRGSTRLATPRWRNEVIESSHNSQAAREPAYILGS